MDKTNLGACRCLPRDYTKFIFFIWNLLGTLDKYLPARAVAPVTALLENYGVHLKIVSERRTRHGDYRRLPDGRHLITVNSSLNPYRFLITLVHEIAHLVAFQKYGAGILPHGAEWKKTFQHLMLPFIRPEVFPSELLPLIAKHFINPRASSDTDSRMSIALQAHDKGSAKTYIFELHSEARFLFQGRMFKRGAKLRKRYQCTEIDTGRKYVFQPNAQVELVK